MYIKSGHRFLSDKGQIIFPGPPTRSPQSYMNYPATTSSTSTVAAVPEGGLDEDGNYIDMWRSKSSSSSDMLSDKIQMFYIYITVTISSVLAVVLLATFGYMCYKRKGFQSIDNQQDIERTRRRSSSRPSRNASQHQPRDREATTEDNPGQTLLR